MAQPRLRANCASFLTEVQNQTRLPIIGKRCVCAMNRGAGGSGGAGKGGGYSASDVLKNRKRRRAGSNDSDGSLSSVGSDADDEVGHMRVGPGDYLSDRCSFAARCANFLWMEDAVSSRGGRCVRNGGCKESGNYAPHTLLPSRSQTSCCLSLGKAHLAKSSYAATLVAALATQRISVVRALGRALAAPPGTLSSRLRSCGASASTRKLRTLKQTFWLT